MLTGEGGRVGAGGRREGNRSSQGLEQWKRAAPLSREGAGQVVEGQVPARRKRGWAEVDGGTGREV